MNSNLQVVFNNICKNILSKRDEIESEYGNTLEFLFDDKTIKEFKDTFNIDINMESINLINKIVLHNTLSEDECTLISLADQIYTMLPKTEWRYQLKKLAEAENLRFVF